MVRPVGPAAKTLAVPPNPDRFWGSYFAQRDIPSTELYETIATLRSAKKLVDVEAALRAYIIHRPGNAEAWMYELLSVVIEVNSTADAKKPDAMRARAEEAKLYLGYAATAALKGRDATQLVSVADKLHLRGRYEEEGPLLDMACDLAPHRGEPNIMQINLATATKDPNRMAEAIDRLLSLGWSGRDEKGKLSDVKVRRDARNQAEKLAKVLKEEGKNSEADAMLARLPDSEARDLFVKLTWKGVADLDLSVLDPLGATARYGYPRTVFGGALLVNGEPPWNEEVYVCPRGFDGKYVIKIDAIFNDPEKPVKEATLEIITHEGTANEEKKVVTVQIPSSQAVTVNLTEGRRKQALPFVAPAIVEVKKADPKKAEIRRAKEAGFNEFKKTQVPKK